MKRINLSLLFVSLFAAASAQDVPPELTQLKAPYVQATTTIRANAEARAKPLTTSYLSALVQMEKQFASDPVISVMLVQEMARVGAGKAPTAADTARFTPQLLQLRTKYDADLKVAKAPFVQQEAQFTRQYLASLGTLERRFTSQNAITKSAAVTAEIQAMNASLGAQAGVPKEDKSKADSTITAGTAKAIGSLDSALADKIAAAVQSKAYSKSLYSNNAISEQGPLDAPKDGALLVGFEIFQPSGNHDEASIRSMRPYFLTKEGIVPGKDRGTMERVTNKIMGRPGYAIAGLLVTEDTEIQAIFMKVNPATGQLLTDSPNTYKSQVYGKKSKAKPKLLGGDGRLVVGVYGRTGADADGIGLIMMNK